MVPPDTRSLSELSPEDLSQFHGRMKALMASAVVRPAAAAAARPPVPDYGDPAVPLPDYLENTYTARRRRSVATHREGR